MKQIKKIIMVIVLAFTMLGTVFVATGCGYENLSNEEHIKRISERVEARFFGEGSEYPYTDFTVTILYSLAEEPRFFMVEFEPNGFFYGTIHRNEYYALNFYRGNCGRFTSRDRGWRDERTQPVILHYRSHFYVAGIAEQRKYLSPTGMAKGYWFYPMIREGEYFVGIGFGGGRYSVENAPVRSPSHRGIRISNLQW
ncbi:MAG: hypothetical protein FWC02_03645 [Firmicutes bacterium]|nr:hypothetical protein [Bacillota bacterium]